MSGNPRKIPSRVNNQSHVSTFNTPHILHFPNFAFNLECFFFVPHINNTFFSLRSTALRFPHNNRKFFAKVKALIWKENIIKKSTGKVILLFLSEIFHSVLVLLIFLLVGLLLWIKYQNLCIKLDMTNQKKREKLAWDGKNHIPWLWKFTYEGTSKVGLVI